MFSARCRAINISASDAGIPEDGWISIKLSGEVKTVETTNRHRGFRIEILAPQSPE